MDAGSGPTSRETSRRKYSNRIDRNEDRPIRGRNPLNCSPKGHLFTTNQPKPLQQAEEAIVISLFHGCRKGEADEGCSRNARKPRQRHTYGVRV